VPKNLGNKQLKRIYFIMNFLKELENDESIFIVIDEVGFGTKNLRNYAYAPIGCPVVLKTSKISHNLTCTATM